MLDIKTEERRAARHVQTINNTAGIKYVDLLVCAAVTEKLYPSFSSCACVTKPVSLFTVILVHRKLNS
jgi:hypothetical protein